VGSQVEAIQALVRAQKKVTSTASGFIPAATSSPSPAAMATECTVRWPLDGPWEWRQAVRQMYAAGFKHIKDFLRQFTLEEAMSGGGGSKDAPGSESPLTAAAFLTPFRQP